MHFGPCRQRERERERTRERVVSVLSYMEDHETSGYSRWSETHWENSEKDKGGAKTMCRTISVLVQPRCLLLYLVLFFFLILAFSKPKTKTKTKQVRLFLFAYQLISFRLCRSDCGSGIEYWTVSAAKLTWDWICHDGLLFGCGLCYLNVWMKWFRLSVMGLRRSGRHPNLFSVVISHVNAFFI